MVVMMVMVAMIVLMMMVVMIVLMMIEVMMMMTVVVVIMMMAMTVEVVMVVMAMTMTMRLMRMGGGWSKDENPWLGACSAPSARHPCRGTSTCSYELYEGGVQRTQNLSQSHAHRRKRAACIYDRSTKAQQVPPSPSLLVLSRACWESTRPLSAWPSFAGW